MKDWGAYALQPIEYLNKSQFHHSDIIAAREVKNSTPNQNNMHRKTWFIKTMFRTDEKELQDIATRILTWTVSNYRIIS